MLVVKITDQFLDFLYSFVPKFVDKKTFRYGISGVFNLVLGWICYYIIFNFILHQKDISLTFIPYVISAKTFTIWVVSIINLIVGFALMKYVVFTESELCGIIQLFRYAFTSIISVCINIILMKILEDYFDFYPTPSFIVSTLIIVIFSYIMQNKFSFK